MLDATPGATGITLTALAADLEIKTPSLYNHVANLDDLHYGLAVYGVQELTEALQQAIAGKTGRAALEALAHAFRRFARTHPGLYPFTVRAPDPEETELMALSERLLQMLILVLASYNVTEDDAIHGLRGLRALLHGFCTLEAAAGYKLPLDQDASFDRALDIYLDGLQVR